MRIHALIAAAAMSAALTGCYTYPVYQPAPVARLTPEQSAALANQQYQNLSPADRDRLARDNAQVARDDQSAQSSAYAVPVTPYYVDPYPYYGYGYGYPYYYGGFYPFYPGVSLSFGFGRYYGGGFRGGYRGGYGGGFHGHR